MFADWRLFGEFPVPLYDLPVAVVEELRFYANALLAASGETADAD